ncbi:MAG TPA: sulfatase-like hydrolase/transferase [Candidatus Omnitrophota bacterium]|nr:sulfatase-like hydrolase/transferase [Candidatus Omnitrophota bacterium]
MVVCAGVTVLYLILKQLLKDSHRAGFFFIVILAFFMLYDNLFDFGIGYKIGAFLVWRHKYILPAWTLIFFLFAYWFLIKKVKVSPNLTGILNVVGLVLVLLSVFNTVLSLNDKSIQRKEVADPKIIRSERGVVAESSNPDIYYIILDMYGGNEVLLDYFNYDNTDFYAQLRNRGFFVADRSVSNYDITRRSLPSSLNMRYLDLENDSQDQSDYADWHSELVKNSEVSRFLRAKGYRYINVGFKNEYADENYFASAREANAFERYIYYKSLLERTLFKYPFGLYSPSIGASYRNSISYQFNVMRDIARLEGPNFVYNHIISPHWPYVFDKNCEPTSVLKSIRMGQGKMYTDQIQCVNIKTLEAIDAILKEKKGNVVILIQGDHGPGFGSASDFRLNPEWVKQRHMILNAYFFPQGKISEQLYGGISPVNSFRVVFNELFNQNLELFPDKAFAFENSRLIDVTSLIQKHASKQNQRSVSDLNQP